MLTYSADLHSGIAVRLLHAGVPHRARPLRAAAGVVCAGGRRGPGLRDQRDGSHRAAGRDCRLRDAWWSVGPVAIPHPAGRRPWPRCPPRLRRRRPLSPCCSTRLFSRARGPPRPVPRPPDFISIARSIPAHPRAAVALLPPPARLVGVRRSGVERGARPVLAAAGAADRVAPAHRSDRTCFWARYLTCNAATRRALLGIPYKTPWNLLPFYAGPFLLAGIGSRRSSIRPPPALVRGAFARARAGVCPARIPGRRASVTYPADPRNPYAYAHTTPMRYAWPHASRPHRAPPRRTADAVGIGPAPPSVAFPGTPAMPRVGYWTEPAAPWHGGAGRPGSRRTPRRWTPPSATATSRGSMASGRGCSWRSMWNAACGTAFSR